MIPHTVTQEGLLLNYLFNHFPKLKKTKIRQLLKFGSVAVNGLITTSHNHPLHVGDTVTFLSKESARSEQAKRRLSFPILYEDEFLIVIDKPEGLLTMGTEKDKIHTAYYELTQYVREKSINGRGRVFIVHRLDRDASGVVVFAKDEKTKIFLQENWNEAIKRYYALVEGVPAKPSGKIESYLTEDKFKRVYSTPERSRDAKHAVTLYKVLRECGPYALLETTLVTGRKNQIRVHLADLGHPIAGDEKYGSRTNPAGRLGLHACLLAFKHPNTGEPKVFESPLPAAFAKVAR